MRICDDLRQAVLQAAIQGKLTKQMPEDGNAVDLLKQIREEKAKLIKEKKINKEKEMSLQKSKRDKDFDIPDNWAWAHFGEITLNLDSVRVPIEKSLREKQKNKIYDYYGASGVIDKVEDYLFDKRLLLIGEDGANLLARSTPIAFIAEGKYWVNNHAHVLDVGKYLLLDYICLYINAIDLSYYVTGTAQPKMNQANMNSIWVSIPPLAEQQRIVARVEELMARIDDLEKTETELEKLKSAFPGDMKAALLQAAMQGKLTEQLPEDGDANEQINNIFAKKESYLWEKGKKKVVLKLINEKDLNFNIPKNWSIIRLGRVVSILGRIGFRGFTRSDFTDITGAISLSPGNLLSSNEMTFETCSYIKWEKYNESPEIKIQNGDLLLVKTGSSYGKCAVVENLPKEATINPQLARIVSHGVNISFLRFVFSSPFAKSQFESFVTGTATPTFSLEKIANFVLPFPPLEEQKRIVEKLDKLLPLCDDLLEKE